MVVVHRLIWDPWNVAHIARHGVTPDEAEEVCHGDPMTSTTHHERLRVIGASQTGRMLTVILDPEPGLVGVYYPVSARPASRKERRLYREQKGGASS